jgi:hypothetical protein
VPHGNGLRVSVGKDEKNGVVVDQITHSDKLFQQNSVLRRKDQDGAFYQRLTEPFPKGFYGGHNFDLMALKLYLNILQQSPGRFVFGFRKIDDYHGVPPTLVPMHRHIIKVSTGSTLLIETGFWVLDLTGDISIIVPKLKNGRNLTITYNISIGYIIFKKEFPIGGKWCCPETGTSSGHEMSHFWEKRG